MSIENNINADEVNKFTEDLKQEFKQKGEEYSEICKQQADYEETTLGIKEDFINILNQCTLKEVFFPNYNTAEDIKENDLIYNCCFYFSNAKSYLTKLNKDLPTTLNKILEVVQNKTTLIINLPQDYKIYIEVPKDNDTFKISVLQQYTYTLQVNAFNLYVAGKEETFNLYYLLSILLQLKDIAYIKHNDTIIDWNHLEAGLLNAIPLTMSLLAIIDLIYCDELKKKILF